GDGFVRLACGDHACDLELAAGKSIDASGKAAGRWFGAELTEHLTRLRQFLFRAHPLEHVVDGVQLVQCAVAIAGLGESACELSTEASGVAEHRDGLERVAGIAE